MYNENIKDLRAKLKELRQARRIARLFLIAGIIMLCLTPFTEPFILSICGIVSVIISVLWSHLIKNHREEIQEDLDAERWREEQKRTYRNLN